MAPLIVYPLVGPPIAAFALSMVIGVLGVFSLGPASLLVGVMYLFFWIPLFYAVLALPLFLNAMVYALAVWRFAPPSVLTALAATIPAFVVFVGLLYWTPATFAVAGFPPPEDLLKDVWSLFYVAPLVAACWWVARFFTR